MEKAEKMSENKIEQNLPKKKTCIWAKISFFSALSSWIILILFLNVESSFQVLGFLFAVFSLALMLIAFFSTIIGSIRIITKRNVLKGWRYIIGGFCLFFIFLLLGLLMPTLGSVKRVANVAVCGTNMRYLCNAIFLYTHDNDGRYPTPDRWCDLLLQNPDIDEETFICKSALKLGDKGHCHYAINPNCSPNSPPDTVLLFETTGGWNQHGGPELLTTEHHKRNGHKVCNVSFNDGHVELVEAENLNKLKWDNKLKYNPNQ